MQIQKSELNYDEIPDNWTLVKLGEIASVNSGYGFPIKYQGKTNGDIPFFKVSDISKEALRGNIYLKKAEHYISYEECKSIKAKLFKKDTIVFAKIGEAIKLNRRAILSQDSLVDNNIACIYSKNKNLYLYYYLLTIKFGDYSGVTAVPSLKKSDIENCNILLPPLKEQQKIASVLSNVDNLVQKTDQIIEQTQRLKKGLMQRLLTKGIGHAKFKKTELGEIPEEWDIIKLKDTISSYKNGIYKKSSFYGRGVLNIRMFNIQNGIVNTHQTPLLEVTEKETLDYQLKPGDILLNRVNSAELVGKAGIVDHDIGPAVFDSMIIRIRINNSCYPYFINYFLNTKIYLNQIKEKIKHAIGQSSLNQEDLNNILIALPSLQEQQKIASILLNLDIFIRKLLDKKKNEETLKKGLMQQLLTGKIRVKV